MTSITGRPFIDEILDITNLDQVQSVLDKYDPDIILHLAAMTNVDDCEQNPEVAYNVNVIGTVNLLKHFTKKFVFISSDYVFNGQAGPYREDDTVAPINVYGQTKLNAEKRVQEIAHEWLIIRTNVVWNVGGKYVASFVDWLIGELRRGNPVRIVTDQWNNPVYTVNLAMVLSELLQQNASGVLHYGSKDILNRYEFARLIANVYGLDESLINPIKTKELKQPARRPLKSGLKTDKIQREYGIKPSELTEDINATFMRGGQ